MKQLENDKSIYVPDEEYSFEEIEEMEGKLLSLYNSEDIMKYAIPKNKELTTLSWYMVKVIRSHPDLSVLLPIIKSLITLTYVLGYKNNAAQAVLGGMIAPEENEMIGHYEDFNGRSVTGYNEGDNDY
jgi:hypothetical protein